jgi:transcriptional regulator with XRE-family HTH domain
MPMKLKAIREERGMSQAVLAKRARISRGYLVRLEAARQDPTRHTLERLAQALGVPVESLFTRRRRHEMSAYEQGHEAGFAAGASAAIQVTARDLVALFRGLRLDDGGNGKRARLRRQLRGLLGIAQRRAARAAWVQAHKAARREQRSEGRVGLRLSAPVLLPFMGRSTPQSVVLSSRLKKKTSNARKRTKGEG